MYVCPQLKQEELSVEDCMKNTNSNKSPPNQLSFKKDIKCAPPGNSNELLVYPQRPTFSPRTSVGTGLNAKWEAQNGPRVMTNVAIDETLNPNFKLNAVSESTLTEQRLGQNKVHT